MNMKDSFADQLKAQSDIWRTQVKEYQEMMEQAGEKMRGDYQASLDKMQARAEEARKLAEKVRGASEAAWKDMTVASQKAFFEMQKGWVDAMSRFQESQ